MKNFREWKSIYNTSLIVIFAIGRTLLLAFMWMIYYTQAFCNLSEDDVIKLDSFLQEFLKVQKILQ